DHEAARTAEIKEVKDGGYHQRQQDQCGFRGHQDQGFPRQILAAEPDQARAMNLLEPLAFSSVGRRYQLGLKLFSLPVSALIGHDSNLLKRCSVRLHSCIRDSKWNAYGC